MISSFAAPWGVALRIATAFSLVILFGVAGVGMYFDVEPSGLWRASMVWLPLLVAVAGSLFMIRGYQIEGDTLIVLRLGWRSRIPLQQLEKAEVDPEAMARSIRTFGNGGLFCFAGRFRNKRLGSYRAFATEPALAVVLHFHERKIVVTPERPQAFVAAVTKAVGVGG